MTVHDILEQQVPQPPHRLDPAAVIADARRRRSRHRAALTGALAAVAVASATTVTLLDREPVTSLVPAAPRPTSSQPASPRPASSAEAENRVAARFLEPAYLPDGARAQPTQRFRNPLSGAPLRAWSKGYALPGRANADLIPKTMPDPFTAADVARIHEATELQIFFSAALKELPPSSADPEYFASETIDLPPGPATLSWPRDGLGNQRIDWVDAAGYHVVSCQRLTTNDGISGISRSELVKVARSLYE